MNIGDFVAVIFDNGSESKCEIIGKRDVDGALLLDPGEGSCDGLIFTLGMREGFKINGWQIDDCKLKLMERRYWVVEGCRIAP